MNLSDLIPAQWKIGVALFGGLALIGALAGVAAAVEKHGYDKAAAVYQPKLDAANTQLGNAVAANRASDATIAALQANQTANDALLTSYEAKIAAADQQADDVAATIRKLQNDDQTVDAFLRTPLPPALRSVLAGRSPGPGAAVGGGANQNGSRPAAKAGGVPALAGK